MFGHLKKNVETPESQIRSIMEPLDQHMKIQNNYFAKMIEILENMSGNMQQMKENQTVSMNAMQKLIKINKNIEKVQKEAVVELKELKMESKAQSKMQNIYQPYLNKMEILLSSMRKMQDNQQNMIEKVFESGYKQRQTKPESEGGQVHKQDVQHQDVQKESQVVNDKRIDFKDITLIIPNNLIRKGLATDEYQIGGWISSLYQKLTEQAFYGYYKKEMTQEESRVFFSRNLLMNTVNMLRQTKRGQANTILNAFDLLSNSTLEFLLRQYPQKKKIFLKPEIERLVDKCEIADDPQYDILHNMGFQYEYDANGNYYKQIKTMINKLMSLAADNFGGFKEEMKNVFYVGKGQKHEQNEADYVEHRIGRKISENTASFSQQQMNSRRIEIKSPEILRILIKWIQELESKIYDLDKNIENRYFPYSSNSDEELRFSKQDRSYISQRFKQFLQKTNEYKFEKNKKLLKKVQTNLISFIDRHRVNFEGIQDRNIDVGLATLLLSGTVCQIAPKYLNAIINTILQFQNSQSQPINQWQKNKSFKNINYITFSVFDLLRAKCAGTVDKARRVYENLKNNKNFKIIRVKNRLQTGNRDFLINLRWKNTPIICQLQLGLIMEESNSSLKQDCLDHFNHYIYELRRSKYGALTEAAIIFAHNSETVSYFDDKFKKARAKSEREQKIKQYRPVVGEDNVIYIDKNSIQQASSIYLCHNCLHVKYPEENYLKLSIDKTVQFCGECVINSLEKVEKTKYLIGDDLSKFFEQIDMNKISNHQHIPYYVVVGKDFNRLMYFRIQNYFIEAFSSINGEFKFKTIEEVNAKYIFQIKSTFSHKKNLVVISDADVLKGLKFRNQERKLILLKQKALWKQAVYVQNSDGDKLLVNSHMEKYGKEFEVELHKYKKYQQIKRLIDNKVELMDLQYWRLGDKFFEQNLVKIKHKLNLLNLNDNDLKTVRFLKNKFITELRINQNSLEALQLDNQSIQKLEARFNKLSKIKIEQLVHLQELNLQRNYLEEIELTNPQLQRVYINSNLLRRVSVQKLQRLKYLNLYFNKLTSVEIQNSNLETLVLSRNLLSSIDISNLRDLKVLVLDMNAFESVSLINTSLLTLSMKQNKLTSVDITRLDNLKSIDLSMNNLQSISLDNAELEKVVIRENQLNSLEISKLNKIVQLDVSKNALTSLKLTNDSLTRVDASVNSLEQLEINELKSLKYLDISSNKLETLALMLPAVENLIAHHNMIRSIDIGQLNSLKVLHLGNNQFKEITLDNQALIKLTLTENMLEKVNLTLLANIKELDLSKNQFADIALDNRSLETLDLSENQFAFIDLSQLINLHQLNLAKNQLSKLSLGHIALEKLDLSSNCLTEMEIGSLIRLKQLDLQSNFLVDAKLHHLKLEKLDLSDNSIVNLDLTGLANLKELYLNNNPLQTCAFDQLPVTLQIVDLQKCGLQSLVVSTTHFIDLKKLNIAFNKLKSLTLPVAHNLEELFVQFNNFDTMELNLQNYSQLKRVVLGNLDFTTNMNLSRYVADYVIDEQEKYAMAQLKSESELSDGQALQQLCGYPNIDKICSQLVSVISEQREQILITWVNQEMDYFEYSDTRFKRI